MSCAALRERLVIQASLPERPTAILAVAHAGWKPGRRSVLAHPPTSTRLAHSPAAASPVHRRLGPVRHLAGSLSYEVILILILVLLTTEP
jgi:hypothetical protein